MERIHLETRGDKNKIEQGSALHIMLVNAELQIKNQTSQEKS